MTSIAINLGARCNAACAHCCFGCSPTSKWHLEAALVDRIVDEAIAEPRVRSVSFTGGEPTLDLERLLTLVERVSAAGKLATCVSNCGWGISMDAAERVLRQLDRAGLAALTVSYDDFHAEFVPLCSIRNVLQAAKHVPMSYALNIAVTNTRSGDEIIHELGTAVHGVRMTKFPVMRVGRARRLPESEFVFSYTDSDELRCPGFELAYHHDGLIYPCCSPAVFGTELVVGRAQECSVSQALDRLTHNRLLATLSARGPSWFVHALRAEGVGDGAGMKFVSSCELCMRVFSVGAVARASRSIESLVNTSSLYWSDAVPGDDAM